MKNYIKTIKCHGLEKNVIIDRVPEFSWELKDCNYQTSYSLKVFNKKTCVYDSGEIVSKAVRHICNFELLPETEYKAELFVNTDNGSSKKTVCFSTALTNGFNKKAKWITCNEESPLNLGGHPALYFRKEIEVSKIKKTIAYVSGLGLFAFYVNGKKVNNNLEMPFTNYNVKVLYGAYEISKYLNVGKNTLEIVLGDGWYNQNSFDTWRFFKASWKDVNKFLFQAKIDGKLICSDTSWECSNKGKITRSSLRLGETHDNTIKTEYSLNAQKCDSPKGVLRLLFQHPITCHETLSPVSVLDKGENYITYDFGRNISGHISFYANGKKNDQIKILYGDRLDGVKIDNVSNSQYVKNEELRPYFQNDFLTLDNGDNYFEPLFVYHGFQYVTIYAKDSIKISDIKAHFVYSGFDNISDIKSTDKRINVLQKMCMDSTKANYVGIPTDCPHREKNGWTGDLQLSIEQMLINFNVSNDLLSQLENITDCQFDSGIIPCIAPADVNTFGYAWGTGPAWDIALFNVPYYLVTRQNDFRFVENYLPHLEKYLEYIKTKEDENGLVAFGLGDWNIPRKVKIVECPLKLTDSLYYLNMLRITAFLLEKVKKDNSKYSIKAENLKNTIIKTFIDKDGNVANNGLTALSAVLFFKIVDGALYTKIFNKLLDTVKEYKYNMKFGILGARYTFEVLGQNGEIDTLIKMFKNNKYPSFGKWIKRGAVTLWEDYEGTNSRNHFMYSSISAVFYKYFLGINCSFINDEQIVSIKIPNTRLLKGMSGSFKTPNGIIKAVWKNSNGKLSVKVDIPSNVNSKLILPNGKVISNLSVGKNEFTF